MRGGFLSLVGVIALSACATKNELPTVNSQLERKGSVNGKAVGLDDDKHAVLQEERDADQELRAQLLANNKIDEDLAYERNTLQRCRDELADPRLGGHGFAKELPSDDEEDFDGDEQIGLDDAGDMKVVRKQGFVENLRKERKRGKNLKRTLKLVKEFQRECEQKMRVARSEHGLSPTRYQAQGYFTQDGTWVMTHKGEKSLDDAFEIAAKNGKESKENVSSF